MIGQALQLVSNRLNSHLTARFSVSEDLVTLSPLTDVEGKQAVDAKNRLVIFLTNIAEDRVPRNSGPDRRARRQGDPSPMHLDIYFILAAGHDAEIYGEGLKILSEALIYFQSRPLWTPENTPEMPEGIDQLSLELTNLRVEELAQLWGNLGGRYVPSVMFRMRSVLVDAGGLGRPVPPVTTPAPLIRARQEAQA